MRAIPAVRAARSGLSGRRVQAIVIGLVVLVSTAASGHWATQPGQIVLSGQQGPSVALGTQVTATGVPGSPHPGTLRRPHLIHSSAAVRAASRSSPIGCPHRSH